MCVCSHRAHRQIKVTNALTFICAASEPFYVRDHNQELFLKKKERGEKNGPKTNQVQTLKETLVAACCTHGGSDFSSDLESAEVDFWGDFWREQNKAVKSEKL